MSQRLRGLIENQREKMRTRRELRGHRLGDGPDASIHPPVGETTTRLGSYALLVTALVAIGSAAFAVGALFLWQSWSQRSDPPVDDLIPFLADAPIPTQQEPSEPPSATLPAGVDDPEQEQRRDLGDPSAATETEALTEQIIVVHVSGAVLDAGVVELAGGSRVFEAVHAAGGAQADADLDRVNLAAPMVDGERIHIPAVGEDVMPQVIEPDRPGAATPDSAVGATGDATPLDINAASANELESLSGIGPSIAQAIVATRDARGPFLTVDELLEVPGIGVSKLEAIRDRVIVVGTGR